MITELDQRYIVLKVNDVNDTLTPDELNTLDYLIERIRVYRKATCRNPDKMYVVVSEQSKNFETVKQMVLDELNETTD